jgi:PmbA protein
MSDRSMVTQPSLNREAELDRLEAHVADALCLARKAGASGAAVSAHMSQGLSVSVRLGEVETLEHMQDRGVSVTVFMGSRKGQASSADLRRESMESCVGHALDIARFTQEDKANGLADLALLATEFPDLDLWHPVSMDAAAAIDRA